MQIWLIPLFIVLFVLLSLYVRKPQDKIMNKKVQNRKEMKFTKCNKCIMFILLVLFVFMFLVYFGQNYILYIPVVPGSSRFPSQNNFPYRHPRQQNLECIDIQLQASDGVKIRGWHILHRNSKRIVVYFHENAGNIGYRIPFMKEISERTGSDVILVAYRGFSESESFPSEKGIEEDSYAILDYALRYSFENEQRPVYILGRSLGGAVGINVGVHEIYMDRIKGLIVENTFTSISDMVDSKFYFLRPFKFLLRNFWPSIERIDRIIVPILFVVSMNDQIVPVWQMQQLIQVSKKKNREVVVYRIENGTHNYSWRVDPLKYFSVMRQYFSRCQV